MEKVTVELRWQKLEIKTYDENGKSEKHCGPKVSFSARVKDLFKEESCDFIFFIYGK